MINENELKKDSSDLTEKKIILGNYAGFCFGVKRAIDETYKILETEKSIYAVGSLIHNEVVVNDLKSKGLIQIDDYDELLKLKNKKIIIRTHGIEKQIKQKLIENENTIYDLTCPFVQKIQKLVEEWVTQNDNISTKDNENLRNAGSYKPKYRVILIGDKNHQEVKGIKSYAKNEDNIHIIIEKSDINGINFDKNDQILVVFQTTTNVENSKILVDILRNLFYNIKIVNTICSATTKRQEEVRTLAEQVDAMLIVGSKTSSNTCKLYEISKSILETTYLLNDAADLDNINLSMCQTIGVSAGASTPKYLIEEILKHARFKF